MADIITQGPNRFYANIDVAAGIAFPSKAQLDFCFQATNVIISNDSDEDTLTYSFQRPKIHGELFCGDGPFAMDNIGAGKMWLRFEKGTNKVRVWAWRI